MSREAMKQALDALELLARYENSETKIQVRKKDGGPIVTIYPHKIASDAAQLLRAALDEPGTDYERGFVDGMQEQMKRSVDRAVRAMSGKCEWQGLTDEERESIWIADQMTQEEWDTLFDTIEAKLKEKNCELP